MMRRLLNNDRDEVQGRGFTLLELMLVVGIIGILSAFAIPRFDRLFERSRVDMVAANLKILGRLQQIYWLKNKVYAENLGQLKRQGLLSAPLESFGQSGCRSCQFVYVVQKADEQRFKIVARRVNSGRWHGEVVIDQQQELSGKIRLKKTNYLVTP